jgi:hypothetical protein
MNNHHNQSMSCDELLRSLEPSKYSSREPLYLYLIITFVHDLRDFIPFSVRTADVLLLLATMYLY